MSNNVGSVDRVVRVLIGLVLLAFAFYSGYQYAWLGYIGIVPILTAIFGTCPLYSLLGVSTCAAKHS
jgi:hypothetical protein